TRSTRRWRRDAASTMRAGSRPPRVNSRARSWHSTRWPWRASMARRSTQSCWVRSPGARRCRSRRLRTAPPSSAKACKSRPSSTAWTSGWGGAAAGPSPLAARVGPLPAELEAVVGEALVRLVDYQDEDYARRYLDRLRPFMDGDVPLAVIVARHLAVWMTYEDAIRVADLKTRADRFQRIRREHGAPRSLFQVPHYFHPALHPPSLHPPLPP